MCLISIYHTLYTVHIRYCTHASSLYTVSIYIVKIRRELGEDVYNIIRISPSSSGFYIL